MTTLDWMISSVIIITFCTAAMGVLTDLSFFRLPKKKRLSAGVYFLLCLVLNLYVQIVYGPETYGYLYFLIVHIPCFLLLLLLSRYRGIKLAFLFLSVIIFSSAAMFVSSLLLYFVKVSYLAVLPGYLLMFFCVRHFFKAPFFYILEYADNKLIGWLSILPLLYYFYNYYTTRYQFFTLLTTIDHEFWERGLTLAMVLFSYCLMILYFKTIQERSQSDAVQEMISMQLHDATQQIQQLRGLEKQAAIYRHDMRHHFHYLYHCITQNKSEEALTYIQQIYDVFDDSKIHRYSSNESLNLIFSSFQKQAIENGITFTIEAPAQNFSRFTILDLCKLLYNGLENAIKASCQTAPPLERYVYLHLYEKQDKLCCEIRNSYGREPRFDSKGIPLSDRSGHGIGVRSMVYVVEKYNGMYKFSNEGGEFIFQMYM